MGNHGADLHPFANRDFRRRCCAHATGGRFETAHVDMELVLGPDGGGVGDKRDLVVFPCPSVRSVEERLRPPTRKIVGIEDPLLQSAEAPNYFNAAWRDDVEAS